ncbi:MAG: flagellar biosynthetic protein FliR [Candidatus Margulisiibacteriota bacterium]
MIISFAQLAAVLLIFARICGVFIEAPLFSSRTFPAQIKTALAIWIALVLWFVVPVAKDIPLKPEIFLVCLVSEVVLGFLIGFVCNILFTAIQAAGEIMDLQMGLSVAQALDPVFGATISVVGRLMFYVGLMMFITLNGHHMLLSGLHQSFVAIPAGAPLNIFSGKLTMQLLDLGKEMWLIAIQLSAPVVLIIFISDFTFGIVSRVAPQVNVFMLGFQVKPALGLFALLLSAPLLTKYIANLVEKMGMEIIKLVAILK